MKHIDVRFSKDAIELLRSMIGQTMLKYKCDPFIFSTSVYGLAGIIFKNGAFAFTNFTEPLDYYGVTEDVAVFRLVSMPEKEIYSQIQGEKMIEVAVNNQIKEIHIVNENQSLFEDGIKTYDVWLTRGVIFKFIDGLELSFEKNIWFSEDITIERGYDLITRFSPVDEFLENWEGEYRGECTRETITLTDTHS